MRAALYFGRQDLRLMEVPEPEPGPGEVKLRVRYNGICGSDLLEYFDGPVTTRSAPHPLTGVQNPVIMGSSCVAKSSRLARASMISRSAL